MLNSAYECSDKLNAKAQKITIKLPWEILTIYSEVLPQDDEEDEDDIEAHEASVLRLKVSIDEYFLRVSPDFMSKPVGSGRCDEADDERRVSTLLGLSTSLFHIS
jgi:hypothetical protein